VLPTLADDDVIYDRREAGVEEGAGEQAGVAQPQAKLALGFRRHDARLLRQDATRDDHGGGRRPRCVAALEAPSEEAGDRGLAGGLDARNDDDLQ